MEHDDFVKSILENVDPSGRLKARERNDLEFKKSFIPRKLSAYARTMAAFANNVGGYILFGIKDSPREIIGIDNSFDEFDTGKITENINSLFSPEIEWKHGIVERENVSVGYIYVNESLYKPIISLKNEHSEKINNGDIFYRYRGRTEKIKFPEMRKMITAIEKREREGVLKLVEMIRKSNTTNLGIVNYNTGSLTTPYGVDVSIEKKLILQVLRKAKYIKSGSFDENSGTPVLKVTGNIDLAEEIPIPDVEPDIQYPYLQKNLANTLGITAHQVYALIWKFKMKEKKKFHLMISVSNSNKVHKFSIYALHFLQEKINDNKSNTSWLSDVVVEFNQYNNNKKLKLVN